jgi:hypothetical protein
MTPPPATQTENSAKQTVFNAVPFVGAFSLSQLTSYPNNVLAFLIPFLAIEGVLIVFFLNKVNKKKQAATTNVDGKNVPVQPKHKSLAVQKYEISEDKLRFSSLSGFPKKRWATKKEFPIYEISAIENVGNELSVTWKDATDWFVIQKKGETFSGVPEQILGMLADRQKALEDAKKAEQRRNELSRLVVASVGVVDLSFDMLMALQTKPVNWEKLEIYVNTLSQRSVLPAESLLPLTLDFSGVAAAVKSELPENASKETFKVLKAIYNYFAALDADEDFASVHPNFSDAKTALLACYTLNDIYLGKIVGEKDLQKQSAALESALQSLSKETGFKVDFESLKAGFDSVASEEGFEGEIEDVRETFRAQLGNLQLPPEVFPVEVAPTEEASAPTDVPPTPTPPPQPQPQPATEEPKVATAQPETAPIEPQPLMAKKEEPMEPSKTEDTVATSQPADTSDMPKDDSVGVEQETVALPPETQVAADQPISESPAVEPQNTQPIQTEQPRAQTEELAPADATSPLAAPESSLETKVSEPPVEVSKPSEDKPKKKGFGQRLRKSIMGY